MRNNLHQDWQDGNDGRCQTLATIANEALDTTTWKESDISGRSIRLAKQRKKDITGDAYRKTPITGCYQLRNKRVLVVTECPEILVPWMIAATRKNVLHCSRYIMLPEYTKERNADIVLIDQGSDSGFLEKHLVSRLTDSDYKHPAIYASANHAQKGDALIGKGAKGFVTRTDKMERFMKNFADAYFRGECVFYRLMTFIARQEEFVCENCGIIVLQLKSGSYRNHCPKCLFSKHVDKDGPGDRANACQGLMMPIGLDSNAKKGFVIIHECMKCGYRGRNKAAEDDCLEKCM